MAFQDIYKNHMLAEGRIDDIKSRYSQFSPEHIDEVVDKALPDNDKKHIDWVMKHYANGNIRPSDFSATKRFLEVYERNKPAIGKGLGSVNGIKDLRELVRPFTNVGLTKEQRIAKNRKLIHEDEHLKIEQHKGSEACEDMGWLPKNNMFHDDLSGKAKWCISLGNGENKGFLSRYTEGGKWPVHTITTKKDGGKYALVLNKDEYRPEFRDENDRRVDTEDFINKFPSVLNSSSGHFLVNHSLEDDNYKDFLNEHVIGTKVSTDDLRNFYEKHVKEGGDVFIPDVRNFIGRHPNATHELLSTMVENHDLPHRSAYQHPNYNIEADVHEMLKGGSFNEYNTIITHAHLKPHHIDAILQKVKNNTSYDDIASALRNNNNATFTSPQIHDIVSTLIGKKQIGNAIQFYDHVSTNNETRKMLLDHVIDSNTSAARDTLVSPYTKHPELVNHLLNKKFDDHIKGLNTLSSMVRHKIGDRQEVLNKIHSKLIEHVSSGNMDDSLLNNYNILHHGIGILSIPQLHQLNSAIPDTHKGVFRSALKNSMKIKSNSGERVNNIYGFLKDSNPNEFDKNDLTVDTINTLNDENTLDAVSKSKAHLDLVGKPNQQGFYSAMAQNLSFEGKPKTFEHVFNKVKEHRGNLNLFLQNKTLSPHQLDAAYDAASNDKEYNHEAYVKKHSFLSNNNLSEHIINDLHNKKYLEAPHYKTIYDRDDLSEDTLKKHIDDHVNTIISNPNGRVAAGAIRRIRQIIKSPSMSDGVANHFIDKYIDNKHIGSGLSNERKKIVNDTARNKINEIANDFISNKKFGKGVVDKLVDKSLSDSSIKKLIADKSLSSRSLHSLLMSNNRKLAEGSTQTMSYDSVITHPNLSLRTLNSLIDNDRIPDKFKNHALRVFHEKSGQQLLPFKGIKK